LVLLASWILWKERNRRMFHRKFLSSAELCQAILDEANAWIGAGFRALALLTALVEQTSTASFVAPIVFG
jgi:hypothetical protein